MTGTLALAGLVALGGAIGSVARFGVGLLVPARPGATLPVATLLVNVTGSLLIGLLARSWLDQGARPEMRAFLAVGLCGGYTTFSAFSYETARLIEGGRWSVALLYALTSAVLCVGATFAGFALASR